VDPTPPSATGNVASEAPVTVMTPAMDPSRGTQLVSAESPLQRSSTTESMATTVVDTAGFGGVMPHTPVE